VFINPRVVAQSTPTRFVLVGEQQAPAIPSRAARAAQAAPTGATARVRPPRTGLTVKLSVLAAVFLLLLGLGSGAADVEAAKKARPAASGAGTSLVNGVDLPFAFEAAGKPRNARGRAQFDLPGLGTLSGAVTCLNVDGNRATLSGTLDQPVDGYYTHFALVVEDNGPAQQSSADTYWPFISHAPIPCQHYLEAPPRAPITSGDIQVR
jgi:hypothetical protein